MGKTKHLKIRSDWVVSNENEYSISTMTSRFLFKSRVSWIESLKLNRISIKSHGTWIESRNVWIESSLRFKSRFNWIAIWFDFAHHWFQAIGPATENMEWQLLVWRKLEYLSESVHKTSVKCSRCRHTKCQTQNLHRCNLTITRAPHISKSR